MEPVIDSRPATDSRRPWVAELQRTLAVLLISLLPGLLFGAILVFLLLGASACLGWHLWQLYRLERWLRTGTEPNPPPHWSIWYPVFKHYKQLQLRNSKRKRKLHRIGQQFLSAGAALPDGVLLLNGSDELTWFNPAARRLLGLHHPNDIGQAIMALVRHPDFVHFLAQRSYDQAIEIPAPVDPERTVSIRLTRYSKKRHMLVVTDITRIQRLEQTRRDFVANVSHELRTPLTVISGYLETMLDCGDVCAERWQQPLLRMQEQSTRMRHIIQDLLLLARLESAPDTDQQEIVRVVELLMAIAADARVLSGDRQHNIQVAIDTPLQLCGNAGELRSAFSNLVVNAVRYSPAGASIDIHWYADEDGAYLAVADQGDGIAPHHIPRLTERFYRVDRSRQRDSGGTGLGLAIVKHVLARHQARLEISSELGVGSIFTCHFPATRTVLPATPINSRQAC